MLFNSKITEDCLPEMLAHYRATGDQKMHQAVCLVAEHEGLFRRAAMADGNTVAPELKRAAIMQQAARVVGRRLLPLANLAAIYHEPRLQGTDEAVVPVYPAVTDASTTFAAGDGYVMGDSEVSAKKITVDKRLYQPLRLSSSELARLPFLSVQEMVTQKAEKLAYDVETLILGAITAANYPTPAYEGPASAFDSDDVANLRTAANGLHWPDTRLLLLNSTFDGELMKDTAIKFAVNLGSDSVITDGKLPRVMGFAYDHTAILPDNGQGLSGLIATPGGLHVVFAPIKPAQDVPTSYATYRDPVTGIVLEHRRWGNPDMDQSRETIEVNFGFAAGDPDRLRRICTGE